MSQPTANQLHVDGYVGPDRRKKKRRKGGVVDSDLQKLEEVVLKRDFSTDERKKLASEGKALDDGSYPIPDADALRRAAILARSGHGNAGAAKALIARRAKALGVKNPLAEEATSKAENGSVEITVSFIKGEFEGKVWGIVLEPGLEDSQGDIVTEEDVQKAAHGHLREAMAPDVQHSGRPAGAHLIEHFIAPVDFDLAGEQVHKGSWVQAYQIEDPVVKEEVLSGKLTGFSLEGAGVRSPIAA